MRLPDVEGLAAALAVHPWADHPALPGRTNHLRAGVAVPLHWRGSELVCLATLRPASMRRHGGEVSFPGGRPEEEDVDLSATAARECREEVGLAPRRVLGRLSSFPVFTSDFRLEPFVMEIGSPVHAVLQAEEVEALVELELGAVLTGGVIEAVGIPWQGTVVDMPVFRPGGWVMFGATALALTELLGVLASLAGVPPLRTERGPLRWEELRARGARAGQPDPT